MQGTKTAPALNRRSFVFRAIQLAAAPALLAGCGGGGGSDEEVAAAAASGSAATARMTGQVVMPAGLSLTGTRVTHLLGDETVSPTGTFVISFVPDSAMPTTVFDAAGNMLLFGYLRAAQPTLSVRSSAEVLLFRALGMWAHPGEVQVAALTLLMTEDLRGIEAAIGAAIAAHGSTWAQFVMSGGVGGAVAAKVASLGGRAAPLAQSRKRALGMIVDPTDRVSGLIVDGDGIGACTVENDFRRRALIVHTEISTKLEGETTEFDLPPHYINTEISPTEGLSNPLQVIADFIEGKTYYTPVTVKLLTPRYPANAVYTRYRIYAVGPGSTLGAWNDMPQNVKEDGLLIILKAVLFDFVIPVFASLVIPVRADKINEARNFEYADSVLKDLVLLIAKVPELVEKAKTGDFKGCCQSVMFYLLHGTDSIQIAALTALGRILQALFGAAVVVDRTTGREVTFTTFIKKAWDGFDKVLDKGEFVLALFDTAVQVCDIASSSMGEVWDVTVTKAKVSLTPLTFFVEKNRNFTDITATVQNYGEVEGRVFGYRWKCKSGRLYAGGKYGTVIDSTTYNVVGYDALDVAAGTVDQIDVDVVISGFKDEPVGSAKAKVYVTGLTVTPAEKKKLKANESVTLTAATVGMRPLAVGEKVVYKWVLGGTAGTLTATDTETATFKADATKEGLAVVTVEASLGERRIGIATANLTVGDKLVVAGRVFEDHWKDASGCHTGMYIAFPKVQGAKSYDVFVTGMRGYFGTEYRWTVNVIAPGRVGPFPWTDQGTEILGGSPRGYAILGGGNGGGDACISVADERWAAWYQGSTVQVTVSL